MWWFNAEWPFGELQFLSEVANCSQGCVSVTVCNYFFLLLLILLTFVQRLALLVSKSVSAKGFVCVALCWDHWIQWDFEATPKVKAHFAHCNQDNFPTWYLLHPQILNRGAWDWIKFPGWVIVLVHPWLLSKGPEFTVYLHLNKWGLATSKDPHFRCDISPLQRNFDDPRFHWWLLGGQKNPTQPELNKLEMGGLYFMADCQQKRKPVCSVCRDALAVYMLLFSWTHCFPPTTLQTCNNRRGCLPLHEHVRHLLKFVKGSSRPLNAPLSPPVFSVHPPLSPPSPRCSGNWVWHGINGERARTHLNAPTVVSLTSPF